MCHFLRHDTVGSTWIIILILFSMSLMFKFPQFCVLKNLCILCYYCNINFIDIRACKNHQFIVAFDLFTHSIKPKLLHNRHIFWALAIYLWMYFCRHFIASIPLIASHVLHRTHVKKKKRNNNSPLIMLPDSSPNPYVLHEIATLPPSNMCTYRWLQQILRILSFEKRLVDHYNL